MKYTQKQVKTLFIYLVIIILSSTFILAATPSIGSIVLNSTDGSNFTTVNLTAYPITLSDGANVIYDWKLNDSSIKLFEMPMDGGTLCDNGGTATVCEYIYGRNASVEGAPTYSSTAGYGGTGVYTFDGNNDYLDVHPDLSLTNSFSITGWVKRSNAGGNVDTIFSTREGGGTNQNVFLSFTTSNYFRFGFQNNNLNSNSQFTSTTEWYFFAATYDWDTNDRRIYIDGGFDKGDTSLLDPDLDVSGDTYIGAFVGGAGATDHYRGEIDDIIVWNRTLTPEQIEALYLNRTDLISFNETSNDDVWSVCGIPNNNSENGTAICSNSLTVQADTTNPLIDISSPTNNTNTSVNTLNINYTVTDNIAIDSCWYSNDTMLSNTTLADCETNITTITWGEGEHNVTVWANDTSGNENSSSVTFTIDSTGPTFTTIANQTIASTDDLGYQIEATDAFGVSCFNVNDTTNFQINCSGYLENNTALSAGVYNLNITVNDTLGNNNSATMWVEVTAPATTETTTTTTTTSSSGGGGSTGSSGAISSTTSSSHQEVWASIYEGETAEVEINNEIISITSVDFEVTEDVYGPWIKVELQESEDLPSDVDEMDVTVQSYYYVQTGLTLTNDVIENVDFEFQVELDWFEENDLSATEIAMHHFDENTGVWSELVTVHTGSDETFEYYTAEAEGFSYFAVAQASDTIESLVSSVSVETEAISEIEEVEAEEEIVEETIEVEQTFLEGTIAKLSWLAIVILTMLFVVVVILREKKGKPVSKKKKCKKKK